MQLLCGSSGCSAPQPPINWPLVHFAAVPTRQTVRLGNKNTNGPFAPLVVVVRQAVGEKEFNKIRGKAISVHSQGEDMLSSCVMLSARSCSLLACAAASHQEGTCESA